MRNIFEGGESGCNSGEGIMENPEKIAQRAMAARMGLVGRKKGSLR